MNIIKKAIYNMIRNKLLKRMTNNLGEIIEQEDKIICNVSLQKIQQHSQDFCYDLIVRGNTITDKETMELYNLNKPVHFIIKGATFNSHLSVASSTTVDFTFENCEFHEDFCIRSAGNVILRNNKYKNINSRPYNCLSFLTVCAKSLKLINDKFENQYSGNKNTKFGIQVDAENIEIESSRIKLRSNEEVFSVRTKNLIVKDSDINCYNDVYIQAEEISTDNSIVESQTSITIENQNNNNIMGFKSPQTIYNDIDVSKDFYITQESCQLTQLRHTLIDRLKEIRDFCDDMNIEELEKKLNELENQNVYELIKK